jgi:hypothetical protein
MGYGLSAIGSLTTHDLRLTTLLAVSFSTSRLHDSSTHLSGLELALSLQTEKEFAWIAGS